ncbi:MAG: hypothetical protein H6737_16530 [Alphaproteobacteria bacterium]|nr:hypothetical protein [Alphaproteobacteria bacterium]
MIRLAPMLFLAACAAPAPGDRPMPMWQTDAGLFDAPWPDDFRTRPDGTLDFTGLPVPGPNGLVEDYIAFGEQQVGFGNNSAIYLRLDGPVDPALLPGPGESTRAGSSIVLVDVDPRSPYFGERFPVRWHASDIVTAYQPEGLFTVAPVAGFPLRPSTKYALLLTTDAFAPNPAFRRVFDEGHPRHDAWAEVEDALPLLGIRRDDIAVGTVFTTFDPLDEMARIARFVQSRLAPPDLDRPLEFLRTYEDMVAFRTHYPSPVFTHGIRPFLTEGGEFRFDASGDPIIASWDDLRLAVCAPRDYIHAPEGGWPVVIYQHGTGGDYRGFCNSDRMLEAGRVFADTGFVGLGIDQPLHGPRAGDSEGSDLANYNILNPASGTTNFRQGAADALYLARALARRQTAMTTPEGREIRLDPDRITFFGHSQGGQTGAIAAAFWAGDVKATLISGSGGVLSITIVERKDIVDFAQLVQSLADFEAGEEVYELHPVLQLVQMLVERSDMVNYAPYWYSQPLDYPGHTPSSVLMTSGTEDANTPYRSAIAMAVAGRVPPIYPLATSAQGLELRGLNYSPPFTAQNALGYDGPITAAFSQWTDGTHFVVFEEPAAAGMYARYLLSGSEGSPVIALDYDQDEI